MSSVNAEMVRKLREETGAGMMECKSALVESSGDAEKARDLLRKKGLASAAKKAGRAASEGQVGSYIHMNGKIGVLVEVNCETDFVGKTPEFTALVKDIAMHIAATNPLYVKKEDVPASVLDKEKEIYKAQALAAGKPEKVVEKIAEGKLQDYYKNFCLYEQPFVKDDKVTIGQMVQSKVAVIKENIVVRRFVRYQLGEESAQATAPTE
jgi:elongation factor Ts